MTTLDDQHMAAAIVQAKASLATGGIPIGSVLTRSGTIIKGGYNRRVQSNNPILHAEMDCLQNAGRQRSYTNTVLYSTLMPCYMCAGTVVQFGIPRVVVGESETFHDARDFLQEHGVEVYDMDLDICKDLLQGFIAEHPAIWGEDIGQE